jgi:hypothetical protein
MQMFSCVGYVLQVITLTLLQWEELHIVIL